ncbi:MULTISPECIES: TetR/AcrR family transcriptional regulator [unclassified Brevundimonas]|uniref:TetR/AcrR family transcriptional regulator n=1 Tax=unclassified Brevundimonas TaxID=2622653 RepID=UPI000CFD65CF|nr:MULTISPECIES: TetR/AcrR family transcriptional regulator [unclassified Brevundimonas]PRA21841.1 TetR family transcriptional regulator [Brevundimonas sp. MYb27]PQZ79443.1 TetR family transcriptional regulator [Brevundimonas sp. MYb31]PRB13038.1 TetR family transcriptional regulator [Brevundimonas sp. MYb52]PRB33606.1 TetR family transcriptional regulator [Brevundimonas sp. MYb46]PRB40798.1 TetR family transcriptional regulator [Brevundimonas sp. MYb33]
MVLCDAPRPRNANATRQAILEAARERFCSDSYDDVGMRDVARDVGVDAALISRYFGSKEDLFVAVLDSCKNGRDLMDGPREDFGDRLAREIIYDEVMPCQDDGAGAKMRGLLILLRSVGSAKAMDVMQRTSNSRFFDPLAAWIGGPDAPVRARLAAGLIMGMAIGRELSDGYASLDETQKAEMARRLAVALQGLIDN